MRDREFRIAVNGNFLRESGVAQIVRLVEAKPPNIAFLSLIPVNGICTSLHAWLGNGAIVMAGCAGWMRRCARPDQVTSLYIVANFLLSSTIGG